MKIKEDREFYKFCTLMPIKDMNKVSQLADEFETVDMEYPIAVSDRIYEFTIEEVREKLEIIPVKKISEVLEGCGILA